MTIGVIAGMFGNEKHDKHIRQVNLKHYVISEREISNIFRGFRDWEKI